MSERGLLISPHSLILSKLYIFKNITEAEIEKHIVLHDILSHESGETALLDARNILKGLYDATTLSQNQNFQTDILIWNNNIALITLEEPIFGTVLTNPLLAETFRTIFTVMRKNAE